MKVCRNVYNTSSSPLLEILLPQSPLHNHSQDIQQNGASHTFWLMT
jgi:hypothetical protein